MMSYKLIFALSFLALTCTLAQEHGEEGEGGTTVESEGSKPLPPCARPLEELHHSIEEIFGENYTVYINCLSFDSQGVLRVGVASGSSPDGPNQRFIIECRGDVLVALPSVIPDTTIDTTDIRETSCVECNTNLANGSCVETCAPKCERCYESVDRCTRCTACAAIESEMCTYESIVATTCREECPGAETINHELYNHCECVPPGYRLLSKYDPAPGEQEIECEGEEIDLGPSRCVLESECGGGRRGDNETGICWACGLPYCVGCEFTTNECQVCQRMTVLYEHECLACPLAPIALAAIEQEHEIEEEEREQEKRAIELGVSLPVVSILIIVFFVSMSVFAHHRYPHVSYHGHKRHRKPPEIERSMSPGEVEIDDQPPERSNVWRPRPTIVLR